MSPIKILAVEDDPIYAEALELVVHELGYELTLVTDNAAEALACAAKYHLDLILMDIEINGPTNGVELAASLKNICSAPVIYVTSHKDKETFQQAKLTGPNAYIVKPYNNESLQAAIELALLTKSENKNATLMPTGTEETFYLKDSGSLFKINPVDVLYVEVDEKYCTIQTKQRKHTVNMRLKEISDRLSPSAFVQTHRSFIVRKDAIEKINTADQTLSIAGKEIPIGKSFKDDLFTKLKVS